LKRRRRLSKVALSPAAEMSAEVGPLKAPLAAFSQ